MGHLDGHARLQLDQPTGWAGGGSSVPTPSPVLRMGVALGLWALIWGVAPPALNWRLAGAIEEVQGSAGLAL